MDDSDLIRGRLNDRLEALLDHYYPGWMRDGNKALLTPKKRGKKLTSSFKVNLDGPKRGQWYRFSRQVGGGSIELINYALTDDPKGDYARAFEEAREFLGMKPVRSKSAAELHKEEQERRARAEKAEQDRRNHEQRQQYIQKLKQQTVETIISGCAPIGGTLAERYLCGPEAEGLRGLPPVSDWPDDQRHCMGFHPNLEYDPLRQYKDKKLVAHGPVFPALVFFIQNMTGEYIGVQRVFLDPDTGRKITDVRDDIPDAKCVFGKVQGGAIRIGGAAELVGINEGGESALANWFLHRHRFPIWSVVSTSGMVAFEVPSQVKRLKIFPDGDNSTFGADKYSTLTPPGMRAALELQQNCEQLDIPCLIEEAPRNGDSMNLWSLFRSYELEQ